MPGRFTVHHSWTLSLRSHMNSVHRRHPSPGAFEITRTAYRTRLVTDGIRREEIPRARE